MTNGEKFKTAEERSKAFGNYCNSQSRGCNECPLNKFAGDMCRFAWLDLEYKGKPKACPFCGGEAVIISSIHEGCEYHHVECTKCHGSSIGAILVDESIDAWNRRVS
jgi:Lar family restriction alleviation protein